MGRAFFFSSLTSPHLLLFCFVVAHVLNWLFHLACVKTHCSRTYCGIFVFFFCLQDPVLWACLATMAAYAKDLNTAETAYAAIDEVCIITMIQLFFYITIFQLTFIEENPIWQALRRKWPQKVKMVWAKSSPLHTQFLCTWVFITARRLREIWLFSFALFYRQIKSSTSIISKKYQREKEEMPPWRYFVGSRRRQRLFFSKLDSCTEQYRWILISSIGTGMTAFLRHESWS